MIPHLLLLLLLLLLPLIHLIGTTTSAAASFGITLPGCKDTCGNISIPYPFGIESGCYAPGFNLTCNNSYSPPKLILTATNNYEIINISPDHVFLKNRISSSCHNNDNESTYTTHQVMINLASTPYTFSYVHNRLTSIGCGTQGWLASGTQRLLSSDQAKSNFTSSCFSMCREKQDVINGQCSGIGCCQTAIPRGLQAVQVLAAFPNNLTRNFSPCSYSFLVDVEEYKFDVSDFFGFRNRKTVPVVLDWAITNHTCREATKSGTLLCRANSNCMESTNGPGYRCTCKEGYQGNPYIGCQDINECEDRKKNACVQNCTNIPGSYICSCFPRSTGDGRRGGTGCKSTSKAFPLIQVILGFGLGFFFLIVTGSLSYWRLKKKKLAVLKQKFFRQNGGLLLQQQIALYNGAADTTKIFTTEELARATDNYSDSRILGRGGYGIVYKGILPDNRMVAIKKSIIFDENQIEQFINEVVILSQVIHRNVVKILGCCLETEVPLLVYEYISNGTLFNHLHNPCCASSLSWDARLRIGAETARALAYLHSAAVTPIVHRDVKSANILLDQNYTTKVSDFGASRLVPLDQAHYTTMVQGTRGYLDPEYFQTGRLTDKSDVYSFGVVLIELLTGKQPYSSQRSEEERTLANFFILAMQRNELFEILEPRIADEGNRTQLEEIATLAVRCLSLTGEERPTMSEVAEELERARRFQRHPWAQQEKDEEMEELLFGELPPMHHTEATYLDDDIHSLAASIEFQ